MVDCRMNWGPLIGLSIVHRERFLIFSKHGTHAHRKLSVTSQRRQELNKVIEVVFALQQTARVFRRFHASCTRTLSTLSLGQHVKPSNNQDLFNESLHTTPIALFQLFVHHLQGRQQDVNKTTRITIYGLHDTCYTLRKDFMNSSLGYHLLQIQRKKLRHREGEETAWKFCGKCRKTVSSMENPRKLIFCASTTRWVLERYRHWKCGNCWHAWYERMKRHSNAFAS